MTTEDTTPSESRATTALNRRAALLGALTLPAAFISPAGADEHPWVRARRVARELSETLTRCDGGTSMAFVQPSNASMPVVFGDVDYYLSFRRDPTIGMHGDDLIRHHARELSAALAGARPGGVMTLKTADPDQPLLIGWDVAPKETPKRLASRLAYELAMAMNNITPGVWVTTVDHDQHFAMVHRRIGGAIG